MTRCHKDAFDGLYQVSGITGEAIAVVVVDVLLRLNMVMADLTENVQGA